MDAPPCGCTDAAGAQNVEENYGDNSKRDEHSSEAIVSKNAKKDERDDGGVSPHSPHERALRPDVFPRSFPPEGL